MMEGGAGVSLTLDCEDMFKEITKKLYGEEATVAVGVVGVEFPAAERDLDDDLRPEEHITAWGLAALMQNGFPPPGILQANFTPRTDPTAEDRWTAAEEPLAWAHSRVASYNPAQRLFKCTECECVGFLARVAEHWLGTHSQARAFQCPLAGCGFAASWARNVRAHLARDHHSDPAAADHLLRDNPALLDLTRYLQRLKSKVEQARNERRSGSPVPGDTSPGGAGAGAGAGAGVGDAGKRYVCGACPYATDRRDLFTRHENIHRDEKPFHCYICQKQFNRADHVKKHFLRMHRDQPYDLNRIRRASNKAQQQTQAPPQPQPAPQSAPQPQQAPSATPLYYTKPPGEPPPTPAVVNAPSLEYRASPVKLERAVLAKADGSSVLQLPQHKLQVAPSAGSQPAPPPVSAPAASAGPVRRKSVCVSQGERRYACCYCAWSGVDNWCLKRHLNTHLKPFACSLCEYKAARAERLATHVHKVHNKKACAKCPFLADDQQQLAHHLRDAQFVLMSSHIENRNLKVPSTSVNRVSTVTTSASGGAVASAASFPPQPPPPPQQQAPAQEVSTAGAAATAGRRRESRAAGAARLFGYLEASDGSGDEFDSPLEYAPAPAAAASAHYARDKENAAPSAPPLHHAMHHDHCLRY
ncbi:protein charlatan isoform X2 [Hyposmocoma kahamanoa]|uniref:protein charlatan isoform X2 n=1 Tax=Hyposmocoma kahamanoa TaxID=1477025 RepID=UPI000E6D6348|nr:protein charlatan isoform X2 [Hyposmocoma kahamanoa]